MLTTRVPSVFGLLYKAGRAISTPKHKSPVYWANRLYRDKLYEHLISRSFDAVVTSHLFPAEVLTSLKRENRLPVKRWPSLLITPASLSGRKPNATITFFPIRI